MAFFSLSSIKASAISLSLLSFFLFFLLKTPPLFTDDHSSISPLFPKRSLISSANASSSSPSCSSVKSLSDGGLLNYFSLHFCLFEEDPFLSIPFLSLLLLLHFYILITTAQDYFSIVTTKLAFHLNLSPSMGAVTLLALGNGAPDVFASVAAVRGGQYRTGFGAILSAGTFVSAFVVGFVTIYAAPFSVNPAPFVRDVLFYLFAALFLFYVYLSAEIFLWQAIGFVGFYLFFVSFVFWMDFGMGGEESRKGIEIVGQPVIVAPDCEIGSGLGNSDEEKPSSGFCQVFTMISKAWSVPVGFVLKLTIPQPLPSEWSRFYASANIALCPLVLLYSCNLFVPFSYPIVFLFSHTHLPLWLVVLCGSSSLSFLHFAMEKEPPKTEQVSIILVAFVMSVFWISTIAGELLNCLAALGALLKLPQSLLGLTVLAWGNSVGDLAADVALAKAGQPLLAMAGCFAGPMFNMLVGLGTALVMLTANSYPEAYHLEFHLGIVIAFVFLLLSLMGSLLVVIWSRFRVPRLWGFCLVGVYIVFTVVCLFIAKLSG